MVLVNMGTVRREGKWTLEKERDGVYEVRERGDLCARIVTADYEPRGPMDDVQMDVMTETIEVRDFTGAKREFDQYIEDAESGGLGLF